MDNERKSARLVREALEEQCAFLEPDPYLAQRVLRLASKQEEGKPWQISRGLAAIMALVLITVTAVTVSLQHRIRLDGAAVMAAMEDGPSDQDALTMPFSGIDVDPGRAAKTSVLSACGHADTSVEWVRRYTPIGTGEHKLVDTYYALCRDCGEVFWVQDATLLRETHDATMAVFSLGAPESDGDPYTCKYCHVQWYGEEP